MPPIRKYPIQRKKQNQELKEGMTLNLVSQEFKMI